MDNLIEELDKLKEEELREVIEKKIVIEKETKLLPPLVDMEIVIKSKIINPKERVALFEYIEDKMENVVKSNMYIAKQDIQSRFESTCFDKKSKRKFIKSNIKKINKTLDRDIRLIFENKNNWEEYILDYFSLKDYLEFSNSNKVNNIRNRKIIKECVNISLGYALIEFLQSLVVNGKKREDNPHPRIFINKNTFELFEYLKDSVKNEHADYSFIFRAMQKDKFIFEDIKEREFRNWLTKIYSIEIDKLKLYDYCKTDQKKTSYNSAKLLYKP